MRKKNGNKINTNQSKQNKNIVKTSTIASTTDPPHPLDLDCTV